MQLATRLRGGTAGITYWHSSPNADRSLDKAEPDLAKARLTERDLAILEMIYDARILSTKDISRLYFAFGVRQEALRDRKQATQRHMSVLHELGLVFRMRPRLMLGEGTSPYLYMITRLGFDLLRRVRWDRDEEREQVRYTDPAMLDFSRFVHDVDLNDFCTSWCEALDNRGIEWEWTPTSQAMQHARDRYRTLRFFPDAIMRVGPWEEGAVWFVEWERSAEASKLSAKLERLHEWSRLTGGGRPWPTPPRMLVVAYHEPDPTLRYVRSDRGTLDGLLRAAAKDPYVGETAFLAGEDWDAGSWQAKTVRGRVVDLLNPRQGIS